MLDQMFFYKMMMLKILMTVGEGINEKKKTDFCIINLRLGSDWMRNGWSNYE